MKAVMYHKKFRNKYHLEVTKIDKPDITSEQILIKVYSSSLNINDYERFTRPSSLLSKLIRVNQGRDAYPLGGEISGKVVAVGNRVNQFQVGDSVMGVLSGVFPKGGWSEYVVCNEQNLIKKPTNISYSQASVIPLSGIAALAGINKLNIQPEDEILIIGASGGVGLFALQLAKTKTSHITAICSQKNIELVKSFGADCVYDYNSFSNLSDIDRKFDKIIGINGCYTMKQIYKLLKVRGRYVAVGNVKQLLIALMYSLSSFIKKKKVNVSSAIFVDIAKQLDELEKYIKKGILIPHLDGVYTIDEIEQALDYVINSHPQGKVAVLLD
ncbi:NAD(P)-dependent alcohol dehydrogenase [Streptococcus thermophilus]|uniref:Enoyl reductase (ER) domain-containing protein n=2 Tax=Streptococcus TaxID=1301 RepID=A0A0E2Q6K6_STRTR|nr:NAD(P)-dependent alcohol dehydrogenase [Streptococcus thermophilus]ETW91875.1 hypothetical protein X841_00640 [Streptococcus thermophilus M17PTZA496]MBW7797116.1 NAD(P)-dependent alcohol dehydrogenase [Streptococcus thermophilus]MBW7802144.1 NAD(P)-dependent alcohol dehydrogenase [Streptococcus thermophilus]MBW7821741.1 NAD(P)-dependent alcohol dehydrogenase [Streptococcus thermophilus]MCE2067818.1 zinc-binding dehydrogenase [Streptococcus thermophilus]